MAKTDIIGNGTREEPWVLKTPPGTSKFTMYKDETKNPPILVCTVGKTVLNYDASCLNALQAMLKKHGDWMELGSADEQKPAKEGTVEAWARSPKKPHWRLVWLKKGFSWTLRYVYSSIDGSLGAC